MDKTLINICVKKVSAILYLNCFRHVVSSTLDVLKGGAAKALEGFREAREENPPSKLPCGGRQVLAVQEKAEKVIFLPQIPDNRQKMHNPRPVFVSE